MRRLTPTSRYTCLEGFSGPGGMSLGLSQAGFDVRLAFDLNPWAVSTYNANLGPHSIQADARELSGAGLLAKADLRQGTLDLFAGGPPCQGFSKQKRGAHLGDSRNELVLQFARLTAEIVPRFFVLENVAMLGGKRGKQFLSDLQRVLLNYQLYPEFYNSADFGLAQTRERFILVGRRRDVDAAFKVPTPRCLPWRTVGDVLCGLPEPPMDYSEHPDFANHQRARVTALNIRRFSFVPQGGGWQDIPEALRLACHQDVDTSRGGWPDVYGRLRWDGQCPTITGGFDSFTRGRYGHPLQDRPLTPREAARLQGFPDSYRFMGNRGDVRSQIGNAVPPPLAKAIGEAVTTCLEVADGVRPGPTAKEHEDPLIDQLALV